MLSQGSKLIEKKRLMSLPELERPLTVRLKFRKTGSLQYISHLDLQRTFNRVLVRACLPLWYTKGFNPHAKLVFSTPLSVGAQSIYEFLDIRIDREMPCDEIKERLNAELTEELYIEEVYIPQRDFSEICWSSYDIVIHSANIDNDTARNAKELLTTSPLVMTKRTKSGEKDIDIVPMIYSVDTSFDEASGCLKIVCVLSATSTEYLNPEMIVTALKNGLGLMNGDPSAEWYTVTRTELLKQDMTKFN